MTEKSSHSPSSASTIMDVATSAVNIASIPVALVSGGYVFSSKTNDALYDNLKSIGCLDELISNNESRRVRYSTAINCGADALSELKKYHSNWSERYNAKLKEMKFTNIFKRLGGVHHNQALEIIVESVAVVGLVIGFGALLNQLNNSKKTQPDKTI